MTLQLISMILAIVANISYHLCLKSFRSDVNPMVSLALTYFVAMLFSLALVPFFGRSDFSMRALTSAGWPSYLLGFSICLLELGFLLAYRSGWQIRSAALFCNLIVAVAMLPLGMRLFHESLRPINLLGIVLALVALLLIEIK